MKLNDETETMVVRIRLRMNVSGTGHLEIGCSLMSFQPKVKDVGGCSCFRSRHV